MRIWKQRDKEREVPRRTASLGSVLRDRGGFERGRYASAAALFGLRIDGPGAAWVGSGEPVALGGVEEFHATYGQCLSFIALVSRAKPVLPGAKVHTTTWGRIFCREAANTSSQGLWSRHAGDMCITLSNCKFFYCAGQHFSSRTGAGFRRQWPWRPSLPASFQR